MSHVVRRMSLEMQENESKIADKALRPHLQLQGDKSTRGHRLC